MGALQFTKMGFHVVATCLTDQGVESMKNKVAMVTKVDVTKQADIDRLVKETTTYCSNKNVKVWTVWNNAGVSDGGALDWTDMKTYRFVFEVNVFGVIAVTKGFLPLLKANKNSRIINLCSLAGFTSAPMMGAYNGSKHAVEGFAKSLRAELKPWSINVCNINPGFMK